MRQLRIQRTKIPEGETLRDELSIPCSCFRPDTFADSRCGQEAEILGFAPAEESTARG